ncbi:MAG: manganese efflux pump [Methanoregula sp.]|jgi:putative Mn2+ efflux pump MntP
MDCFTVSLAIGATTRTRLINTAAIIGICFAVFQTVMTRTGEGAGETFVGFIAADDHRIAFLLLANPLCSDDRGRDPG